MAGAAILDGVTARRVERLRAAALAKVERMAARIDARAPHIATDGHYDEGPAWWWTSGFWPGLLWQAWRATGERAFAETARRAEDRIWSALVGADFERFQHDLGFQFTTSALARYRATGDPEARRRALHAAHLLAGRFNPVGRFIRARPGDDRVGEAIVDTCMNLPLLFWASEETGDPRFQLVAEAHLDTVLRHFVRADGTCRHVVIFDTVTGSVQEVRAGQGAGPDAAWARGQAWAIYGLAVAARHTGRGDVLRAARQVASAFLALLPADGIARWDLRAPGGDAEPLDSSATAIAAPGLLELARSLPPQEAERLRADAVRLVGALADRCWSGDDPAVEPLLLHGVSHLPRGVGIDVGLIYGDHFFLDALDRLTTGATLWE